MTAASSLTTIITRFHSSCDVVSHVKASKQERSEDSFHHGKEKSKSGYEGGASPGWVQMKTTSNTISIHSSTGDHSLLVLVLTDVDSAGLHLPQATS